MRALARLMPVLVMTALLLVPIMTPVDAQVAPGTSDVGVVPFIPESGQGGNVACTDLEALDGIAGADLRTSGRLNWTGSGFDAALPAGVTVTVTGGTFVAWSSADFPLAAVIVKGSNAANVYVYTGLGDDVFADGGLASPVNPSGGPAGLSNLTLCWDAGWTPPPPDEPDLEQLCLQAAADAGVSDVVWVTDPIVIEDGAVDAMTVPDGFTITYDGMVAGGQVAFTASDPVAMVVTAASVATTHLIDPPSTTGTVPLSANPGDGEVVLCGIVEPVELSCAEVPEVVELGPVPIVAGEVVTTLVPDEIVAIVPNTGDIEFVAEVPVAAVVVAASAPVLIPFDPPVLAAAIPVDVAEAELIEILFCVRPVSDTPDDPDDPVTPTSDPSDPDDPVDQVEDVAVGTLDDPTSIPTGGGPSGRTALALIAFVVLALTGSTTLLVWSRGG